MAAENTREAFDRSYALGFRYLETDIRVTRDGIPVAFHDANLDRVTDGHGRLSRYDWATLQQLQVLNGHRIPTLAELLIAYPDACFTVDVKDEQAIAPLAQVIIEHDAAGRVCVAGAWDRWLSELRDHVGSDLTTALGWRDLTALIACSHARVDIPKTLNGAFAHVPLRLGRLPIVGERLLERAHELGIRVLTWTVNDPEQMHRLLDAGVDGIITDRPDLLREVLVARDQWSVPTVDSPAASEPDAEPTVSDLLS